MRTKLSRTSLLTAAVLAVFSITSVLALTKVNNRQPIESTLEINDGPAGAMFSGRILALTNRGVDFGAANGVSTAIGFAPAVETLSPNRVCTAMNFAVQVDVPPGNGRSRTFALIINGTQSSLIACRISGPSSLTCNSSWATQIVPARSTLSIAETTGAPDLAVAGSAAAFGWECSSATVASVEQPPTVVPTATPTPAPTVVLAAPESVTGSPAEVAECKRILQSGQVSWGGGTVWASDNIDKLCNGTRDARNTIACFQSKVGPLGWAAAINSCKW